MEQGLSKNQIITELTRSAHGDLKSYVPIGQAAAKQEPEFLAHLIAWNEKNGQIRDSKVALPVTSLREPAFDGELLENSLAHLALLDPRTLVRALRFGKEIGTPKHGRAMNRLVGRYLKAREANYGWWERTCIQHRASMKTLYALCHVKPDVMADQILFKGKYPSGTMFDLVKRLKDMPPGEAAGTIMRRRIPFLVAMGALGPRAKEESMVLALIESMSAAELVTNTKMLKKLGLDSSPALRGAYEKGLQKVVDASPAKAPAFKTTRAADAVGESKVAEKLRGAQEKQLDKMSVEGNWLVLGDKSSSMRLSIELARMVAATLARMAKGKVHLVFFDTSPRHIEATGKDYDALVKETARVTANGNTSIGCGMQYAVEKGLEIDGIAIVSDGGENTPPAFAYAYLQYAKRFEKSPPVYLYHVRGDPNVLLHNNAAAGIDTQVFELSAQTDYYSLPALIQTMRVQRYGLVEQIMDTPLLTVDEVFKQAA